MKRGDRYIAYADEPHRRRLYIFVTRVAKDGRWADITVCNCFVKWAKRQKLVNGEFPATARTVRGSFDAHTLDDQAAHWDDVA